MRKLFTLGILLLCLCFKAQGQNPTVVRASSGVTNSNGHTTGVVTLGIDTTWSGWAGIVATNSSTGVGTNFLLTTTAPITGGGYFNGSSLTLGMPVATTSSNGYLLATDWTTFNAKASTSITNSFVTASVTNGSLRSSITNSATAGTFLQADLTFAAPSGGASTNTAQTWTAYNYYSPTSFDSQNVSPFIFGTNINTAITTSSFDIGTATNAMVTVWSSSAAFSKGLALFGTKSQFSTPLLIGYTNSYHELQLGDSATIGSLRWGLPNGAYLEFTDQNRNELLTLIGTSCNFHTGTTFDSSSKLINKTALTITVPTLPLINAKITNGTTQMWINASVALTAAVGNAADVQIIHALAGVTNTLAVAQEGAGPSTTGIFPLTFKVAPGASYWPTNTIGTAVVTNWVAYP